MMVIVRHGVSITRRRNQSAVAMDYRAQHLHFTGSMTVSHPAPVLVLELAVAAYVVHTHGYRIMAVMNIIAIQNDKFTIVIMIMICFQIHMPTRLNW